jgi:hypothetical protein
MLKLLTTADLQRLIDEEIQESLTLDYKASGSLAKDSRSRDELCKDVSSFANSAGEQIIYGIEEQNGRPTIIDQGSQITREWIEQVLDSNVQPRIGGLVITPVPVGNERHAYVATIPPGIKPRATSSAGPQVLQTPEFPVGADGGLRNSGRAQTRDHTRAARRTGVCHGPYGPHPVRSSRWG